jgi:hypothetical protein
VSHCRHCSPATILGDSPGPPHPEFYQAEEFPLEQEHISDIQLLAQRHHTGAVTLR